MLATVCRTTALNSVVRLVGRRRTIPTIKLFSTPRLFSTTKNSSTSISSSNNNNDDNNEDATTKGFYNDNNKDSVVLSSSSSSSFIKSYQLNGIGEGSQVHIETSTGHILATDVPRTMGGTNTAPQPVETLLAAWMGCTQATSIYVSRQLRWVVVVDTANTNDDDNDDDNDERSDIIIAATEQSTSSSSSSAPQRRRRAPTKNSRRIQVHRLHFDKIEAFRDERGSLQLPINNIPDIPSRIQRITGTIRVELSTTIPSTKSPSSSSSSSRRRSSSSHDDRQSSAVNVDDQSSSPPTPPQTMVSLTPSQLELLKEQTEARCPVANMILASGCTIDVQWLNYYQL